MDILAFQIIMVFSFGIFFIPKKIRYFYTFLLQALGIFLTSMWSIQVFLGEENIIKTLNIHFLGQTPMLIIDPLSAFFILAINLTSLTSLLYAKGYLAPYEKKNNPTSLALHYFCFFWLFVSMLMVSMVREGLLFLVVWEIMSVSSFILVIFESGKKDTLKTGMKYLIQMHIGVLFLISGFLYASVQTGFPVGFESLGQYSSQYHAWPIFLLFFIGFGIKAGFVPLHTWLPDAHPAAPSHVSGLMSGIMIKLGIYGILRTLFYIHSDLLMIGIFITIISAISGLLGVIYAIVQHDLKKLLAYHSIENIGIIGIGIGLGVIGLATGQEALAVLGFAGGVLHILNHSLFKSLLFYTAGSVYHKTHTKDIESLGGLIKKMPWTTTFFLLAALAICGLPPFNGFVSEFLIYSGAFGHLQNLDFTLDFLLFGILLALAFIGGLAIFCFAKVFSIAFLGNPRAETSTHVNEVVLSMLIPKFLISFIILLIGLFPLLFMPMILKAISIFFTDKPDIPSLYLQSLSQIGGMGALFLFVILMGFIIRKWQQSQIVVRRGSTWGCGYPGNNLVRQQYTATSFADNQLDLFRPLFSIKRQCETFTEAEIFPEKRSFVSHVGDIFEEKFLKIPSVFLQEIVSRIPLLHSGQLHHYILYALFFMTLVFLLTISSVI